MDEEVVTYLGVTTGTFGWGEMRPGSKIVWQRVTFGEGCMVFYELHSWKET